MLLLSDRLLLVHPCESLRLYGHSFLLPLIDCKLYVAVRLRVLFVLGSSAWLSSMSLCCTLALGRQSYLRLACYNSDWLLHFHWLRVYFKLACLQGVWCFYFLHLSFRIQSLLDVLVARYSFDLDKLFFDDSQFSFEAFILVRSLQPDVCFLFLAFVCRSCRHVNRRAYLLACDV